MFIPRKVSLFPVILLLFFFLTSHEALQINSSKGTGTVVGKNSFRTCLRSVDDPVILIDASYNLALGMTTIGVASGIRAALLSTKDRIRIIPVFGSAVMLFLASYLQTKTESVRFRFDNEAFSIVKADGSAIGDNPVMGGSYRWTYNKIAEYKVFPSEDIPLLLYFKETHTPEEKRVAAPITVSATAGQRYVYPIIVKPIESTIYLSTHVCFL